MAIIYRQMIAKLKAIEDSKVLAKTYETNIEIFSIDGKSTGINLVKLHSINIEELLNLHQLEQIIEKNKVIELLEKANEGTL